MTPRPAVWALAALAALVPRPAGASILQSAAAHEIVATIQVHGNTATPDEEIRTLAGVQVGMTVPPTLADDVAARLRATKRFERVEVLKRFASIDDPSQIALVIIVDEGAVHIEMTGDAAHATKVVKNSGPRFLFLPLFSIEDGYGVTFGGQFALPNPVGANSRLSFPLTWGGTKQAAAELDKSIASGPIDRVLVEGSVSRRTNPFYQQDDDREHVSIRGEKLIAPHLRAGADAAWQHDTFADLSDSFATYGADVVLDTRLDPVLARNAVYARAGVQHLTLGVNRWDVDARGYVGLFGQSIVALRAMRDGADAPLPPYLKPLLGGMANVRGFAAGSSAGDNLVAYSAELILPLTSPLKVGKVGVSVFTDRGTVWDYGQRLSDQTYAVGYGGSIWFSAAFLRLNFAVAHGVGSSTRGAVGANVTF
jgi:outer membrane protein assembly factor BamA